MLLLASLGLHLLHFDGVRLAAPHVQFVISHAELQDALVDPQTWSIEDKVLQGRAGWMSTDTGAKGLLQLSSCAEDQRVLGTVWGPRAKRVCVPESQEGWVACIQELL